MTHPGPRVVLALVAAATAVPAGAEWLRGYGRTVSGMTIVYNSPYPDITSALIVRASDGTSAIEWETEAVPADWGDRPASFIWLAGLATGKGAHRFELSVDGEAVLRFRTSADSSRREWRETGTGGVALSFETVMVDQFEELFGFMTLEVPARLLEPGRPLRLRVAGEKGGSNDWYMAFRDDLRREVWARSEQALVRGGGKLLQAVRVAISHLGPPAKAVVSCTGAEKAALELRMGHNALEFLVPAVDEEKPVVLEVALDDGSVRRGELVLKPVVPREIWLLPHSHVDIGYSDRQPVVEKNHWKYFGEAITLAAKTAGYPEGARFKWNTEQAWAVETYLRQAGEAEKAAFVEALRHGSIGLQATLAGVLTGLCHPEELIRLTEFARRLGREAGTAVDSVMVTDIPGQSWSFVPALALAGIKYVSSGPNYMPSLFDGGDRVGWALKAWGDKPFYWLSPSGREKVLFWMAGRGYSWFHGLNMGSLGKAPPYRVIEYMNELAETGYAYSMVQVRYTIGGDNGPPDAGLADAVRDWNERYVSPRIVIATASEMFAEFERRHGAIAAGRPRRLHRLLGGRRGLDGQGDGHEPDERQPARPGRGALVHPGPPGLPGREGCRCLAPGRPVQRAHLGRPRQRLGPRRRGSAGPVGVQEGLRGPGPSGCRASSSPRPREADRARAPRPVRGPSTSSIPAPGRGRTWSSSRPRSARPATSSATTRGRRCRRSGCGRASWPSSRAPFRAWAPGAMSSPRGRPPRKARPAPPARRSGTEGSGRSSTASPGLSGASSGTTARSASWSIPERCPALATISMSPGSTRKRPGASPP